MLLARSAGPGQLRGSWLHFQGVRRARWGDGQTEARKKHSPHCRILPGWRVLVTIIPDTYPRLTRIPVNQPLSPRILRM